MLRGRDIICISSIDWDFIWQGHQQIMSTLVAHGNRVLFIENTGVRSPRLKDLPRLKHRVTRWWRSTKGFRQERENLYGFSPLIVPLPYVGETYRAYGLFHSGEYFANFLTFVLPMVLAFGFDPALVSRNRRRWRVTSLLVVLATAATFAHGAAGALVSGPAYGFEILGGAPAPEGDRARDGCRCRHRSERDVGCGGSRCAIWLRPKPSCRSPGVPPRLSARRWGSDGDGVRLLQLDQLLSAQAGGVGSVPARAVDKDRVREVPAGDRACLP